MIVRNQFEMPKDRRTFLKMSLAALLPSLPLNKKRKWKKERRRIIEKMEDVMGKIPALRTEVQVRELEITETDTYTRKLIEYESEAGDWVPAYLLVPRNITKRRPAMVCLHQTTDVGKLEPVGLKGDLSLAYAHDLALQGYICIVPDYPFLGDNHFDPYSHGYVSCTMKGIVNHMAAVTLLQSLPQVDDEKVGAIGHSLGGHNALFLAAFDHRVKAVVSSCGFTSFRDYKGGDLTGWSGKRYMPLIAANYHKRADLMPFDFTDILASVAPRRLFISAPIHDDNFDANGVRYCVNHASYVYAEVFHKPERLVCRYPEAGHEFPNEVKTLAYHFLSTTFNL